MQKRPAAAWFATRQAFSPEGGTYAEKVRRFLDTHGMACGPEHRYMDMTSELGELGKELLKATRYGQALHPPTRLRGGNGRLPFSLLALCCEMGLDASKALDNSPEKYEARYACTGTRLPER